MTERDTIFLCWLLSTQPTRGARSAQIRLTSPTSESNSLVRTQELNSSFSQIPKILSARFRCMTSFTPPAPNSYLGFLFWHLWMTNPLRTRVNTCINAAPNYLMHWAERFSAKLNRKARYIKRDPSAIILQWYYLTNSLAIREFIPLLANQH